MNRGDTTMGQIQPHAQTNRHIPPDTPVIEVFTITHRTLQTTEMVLHASDVENKAI